MQGDRTDLQILVVEDEILIAEYIKRCLEKLGYSVPAVASSGEEAIKKATEISPKLVLMDIRLKGDMDGVQAAETIWNFLQIPIVYSTGYADKDTVERAKISGAFGYILKPFAKKDLYVVIETALQRYQLEMNLKERVGWFATIFRSIGDAIIVTDSKECIKLLNPVAELMTGWKQDDALGRDLKEVFNIVNQETRVSVESPVTEALENGVTVYLPDQIKLISKHGIEILIDNSVAPIKVDNGEITGAVLVFRDITKRRQAQSPQLLLEQSKQLQAQIGELQRLNQLKDDFLNTVAHELRTPLANITTAIQMLEIVLERQGKLFSEPTLETTPTARYLHILRDQCEQELSLLNDLLDLQRLDGDTHPLTLTTINLQDWLLHLLETYQDRAQTNQQSLQVNISPELLPIVTDLSSLTRILRELLHNAFKYTPPGEQITITAHPQMNHVHLRVSNSGIEISADELPRVFDKFYRIPNADPWKQGGTGLGLALVKKLVEQLGGQISVDSQAGQTTFTVDLPQETIGSKV